MKRFVLVCVVLFLAVNSCIALSSCGKDDNCFECFGDGNIICDSCNGKGDVFLKCYDCNGKGNNKYTNTVSGYSYYKTCSECGGTGGKHLGGTCYKCDGSGNLKCPDPDCPFN